MAKTWRTKTETIFDKCTGINQNLSSYMRGIEGLRIRLNESLPCNRTEKELIAYLDEYFKTILADMLILKDILFEVEECNYDYTELAYLLELWNDTESMN